MLGRSRECDIRLNDANVSRRHAEIRGEDDEVLGRRPRLDNGTELNGGTSTAPKLSDGDRITLGSTDIRFGREVP